MFIIGNSTAARSFHPPSFATFALLYLNLHRFLHPAICTPSLPNFPLPPCYLLATSSPYPPSFPYPPFSPPSPPNAPPNPPDLEVGTNSRFCSNHPSCNTSQPLCCPNENGFFDDCCFYENSNIGNKCSETCTADCHIEVFYFVHVHQVITIHFCSHL